MAALTGVAALRPGVPSSSAERVMPCLLVIISLVRTAWITDIWHERQSDVVAVERALAPVPVGAAVLPARGVSAVHFRGRYLLGHLPAYWHYPALAVPWQRAFVPTLFTAVGKQPLRVLEPWKALAVPEGTAVPILYLRAFERTPRNMYFYGFLANWEDHFDYLLLLNADLPDSRDQTPEGELQLVADEGFARLYRIGHRIAVSGVGVQ